MMLEAEKERQLLERGLAVPNLGFDRPLLCQVENLEYWPYWGETASG